MTSLKNVCVEGHEVLLPVNHKNYKLRKKGKIYINILTKQSDSKLSANSKYIGGKKEISKPITIKEIVFFYDKNKFNFIFVVLVWFWLGVGHCDLL